MIKHINFGTVKNLSKYRDYIQLHDLAIYSDYTQMLLLSGYHAFNYTREDLFAVIHARNNKYAKLCLSIAINIPCIYGKFADHCWQPIYKGLDDQPILQYITLLSLIHPLSKLLLYAFMQFIIFMCCGLPYHVSDPISYIVMASYIVHHAYM